MAVLFPKDTITIYNKISDRPLAFKRTVVAKCNWQGKLRMVTTKDGGFQEGTKTTIFLNKRDFVSDDGTILTFIPEEEWDNQDDYENKFTLRDGDRIVKGVSDLEINGNEKGHMILDLEQKYKNRIITIKFIQLDFPNHIQVGETL